MPEFRHGDKYKCPECGEILDDAFDVVEHMVEDGEEFNPSMIMPGGFRLLLGSLLRGAIR
jgi:predicted nucleic acid-binding Zn ribbon protein